MHNFPSLSGHSASCIVVFLRLLSFNLEIKKNTWIFASIQTYNIFKHNHYLIYIRYHNKETREKTEFARNYGGQSTWMLGLRKMSTFS